MGILFLNVRDIHFYERKLGRDLKIIEKKDKEKEFKDLWIVTPANSFAFGSSFLIFKVGTGENRNCSQDSGSKILETTLIRRLWIQDSLKPRPGYPILIPARERWITGQD